MTEKQENFVKTLQLHFYINSIKSQRDYNVKEKMYARILQKDLSIYTLIMSLRNFLKLKDDLNSKEIDWILELSSKKFEALRNTCDFYFDDNMLPFLNWKNIVQSIRAQFLHVQEGQDLAFYAFLNYQRILIEQFVEKNVPIK
jgi:hypothetical protein